MNRFFALVACGRAAGHAHRHDLHVRNVSNVTSRPAPAPPSVSPNANQTTHDHPPTKKKPRERLRVHHRRSPDPLPLPLPYLHPHPTSSSFGDRKPGDTSVSDRRRIRGEMAAKNWREIKWIDKEPRGEREGRSVEGVESERG